MWGSRITSEKDRTESSPPFGESHCCNGKKYWRNPSSERIAVQFCHDTSLHGLKYVGQRDRHLTERIFWLIAFVGGITLAAYLISDVWNKYKSNPVFVAFAPKELSIAQLPFPAVTICNVNRIQKSVVLEIEKNAKSADESTRTKAFEELEIVRSICRSKPSLAKMMSEKDQKEEGGFSHTGKLGHGTKVIDFLFKASQPCEDMIQRCFVGEVEFPCRYEFYPVITESGLCCSINMMPSSLLLKFPNSSLPQDWESTLGHEYVKYYNEIINVWKKWDFTNGFVMERSKLLRPFSPETSGKSNSLTLLLDPDLDNYYCTTSDSVGFLMDAHKPIESPHPIDFGMSIPPGAEVYANVIPALTIADPSISDVSIVSRSCYFLNEYPLKYYHAYTDSNCEDECVANFTIEECGCAFYYQPRDNETRICEESDFDCTKNASEHLSLNIGDICGSCYPLCNELDFRISSSLSVIQNHSILWPVEENEYIANSTWYGKPVTILNIFFGERTTVPKVRKKLFTSTDLIASVGGLLGLCLGFSGLSAIELIYFCTMRTWFQRRRVKGAVVNMAWNFLNGLKKLSGKFGAVDTGQWEKNQNDVILDRNKIQFVNKYTNNGMSIWDWDIEKNMNKFVDGKKNNF